MSSPPTSRWSDLRRLVSLPGADRWRLIRAALRLLAIDLRLRFRGFAAVSASVERRAAKSKGGGDEDSIGVWVRAVDVAARHHLYAMPCVPRALALRSLLAEQGIATELRIGVRKEGGELAAHAWIEHRGEPLGEMPLIAERFPPLARPNGAERARAAAGPFC